MNISSIDPFKSAIPSLRTQMPQATLAIDNGTAVQGPSFRETVGGLLTNLNNTLTEPDRLLKESATTGNVDIHDVMIANTKAEILVNVATQVATKVIQAYDRILQLQV